ncbi:MAG: Ig-like domain-containing protein [Cyanobacteria bacterium J06639_14]
MDFDDAVLNSTDENSEEDNQASVAPTAVDDEFTFDANTSAILNVLGNDTDPDDDNLSIASVSKPANGSITINANNTLTYTPATDFNGIDSFTYQVSDGTGGTDEGLVTLTIGDVDTTPVVEDVTLEVEENTANDTVVGTVTVTNADPDATLTFTLDPENDGDGAFAVDSTTGEITVADSTLLDHETQDSIEFTVLVTDDSDEPLDLVAEVTATVVDVNEAPVITNQSFTLPADPETTPLIGTVLAIDPDEGQSLSYAITEGDTNLFSIDDAGQLTILQPDQLTEDSYALTITVTDDDAVPLSSAAQITVSSDGQPSENTAPIAVNDVFTTAVGEAISLDVLSNDTDADNDDLIITSTTLPGNGDIALSTDGTLDYTPDADFTGIDTLTYTISDGNGGQDSATITIGVGDVDIPPVVDDTTFEVDENTANDTLIGTVAVTNSEPGDTFTFALDPNDDGDGAFAIATTTGEITVADSALLDHEAQDSITFTVVITDDSDASLTSEAEVTVSILDLNEAPVIDDQTFVLPENPNTTPLIGSIVAEDPDAGQTISYAITEGDTNLFGVDDSGQLTILNPDGLIEDSYELTVEVTDDATEPLSSTAQITVLSEAENAVPVATDDTFTIDEDTETELDVLSNDTDADEDDLTITNVSDPDNGTVEISEDNALITYTPDPDFTGINTFTYEISDGNGNTDTATVIITVEDVNDPPVIEDVTFSVEENSDEGLIIGTIEVANPDPGETFTFAIDPEDDGNGAFEIDATTGDIAIADAELLDHETQSNITFTVEVTEDGENGLSTTAEITIGVIDVNEAPVMSDQTFLIPADPVNSPLLGTVDANDPDDDQTLAYVITEGDTNLFGIDDSGQLTILEPDQLLEDSYELTIEVTDDGDEPLSTAAQITVRQPTPEDEDRLPDDVAIDISGTEFDIVGTDGDDALDGTDDNDAIKGGLGLDRITGQGGDDILSGGKNADTLLGKEGNDTIRGGNGRDDIGGGKGDDRLAGVNGDDIIAGKVGDDLILGGFGNDELIGDEGNDAIYGEEDNDRIRGKEGDDTLVGGAGNDDIQGGKGIDVLSGGSGDDTLEGKADDDVLLGGTGNDTLLGNEGEDTLIGVDNIQKGRGERDSFTGGDEEDTQTDTFVLGDIGGVFYDDGDNASDGRDDFALVTDFEVDIDTIQLSGSVGDYFLEDIVLDDELTGTGIFWQPSGAQTGELIGFLQDLEASSLDLNDSSQFEFV